MRWEEVGNFLLYCARTGLAVSRDEQNAGAMVCVCGCWWLTEEGSVLPMLKILAEKGQVMDAE